MNGVASINILLGPTYFSPTSRVVLTNNRWLATSKYSSIQLAADEIESLTTGKKSFPQLVAKKPVYL